MAAPYTEQQLAVARHLPNIAEAILSALEHEQPERLPALVAELVVKTETLQRLVNSQQLQAHFDTIVASQKEVR